MSDIDRLVGKVAASGALSKAEKARRREVTRKERQQQKRALRIAAAAENWKDREGKARPTPQRRIKGVFRLREGDRAGVAVAVDAVSSPIGALSEAGFLTDRQREAGHIFEEVARGALGSPAGRSCIDFEPVGHDGDDDGNIEATRRWNSLRRMLSPEDRRECENVCWSHAAPSDMRRLRRGLDATADWAGLEK